MTEKEFSIGTTLLIPSGTATDSNIKHLFIVCTGFDNNGNAVLAPVSSWKNNLCDNTCKLEIGCHDFIKRNSYILYRKCRIESLKTVRLGLEIRAIIQMNNMPPDICERIVAGITKSKQTPWKIKRYFKNNSPD